MTCNLSQADKRMRRAIMHSSHKSAVIHILLLFSSPLISSPFFSPSLCSFASFGFDSGRAEMKENRKSTQSATNKVSPSLSSLVRCHFLSVWPAEFIQFSHLPVVTFRGRVYCRCVTSDEHAGKSQTDPHPSH